MTNRNTTNMKTRQGFVSNSSSSSFVIKLSDMTDEQTEQITNHAQSQQFKKDSWLSSSDKWKIDINETHLSGFTFMTNFDLQDFMINVLGIDQSLIKWDEL